MTLVSSCIGLSLYHKEDRPAAWATASLPHNFARTCTKIWEGGEETNGCHEYENNLDIRNFFFLFCPHRFSSKNSNQPLAHFFWIDFLYFKKSYFLSCQVGLQSFSVVSSPPPPFFLWKTPDLQRQASHQNFWTLHLSPP